MNAEQAMALTDLLCSHEPGGRSQDTPSPAKVEAALAVALRSGSPQEHAGQGVGWAMTEAELEDQVLALCERLHLLVLDINDSRRITYGTGYPDLTIAGRKGALWAELKDASGTLSPSQNRWKWTLLSSGQSWRLWRPVHLWSGQIEADLEAIA